MPFWWLKWGVIQFWCDSKICKNAVQHEIEQYIETFPKGKSNFWNGFYQIRIWNLHFFIDKCVSIVPQCIQLIFVFWNNWTSHFWLVSFKANKIGKNCHFAKSNKITSKLISFLVNCPGELMGIKEAMYINVSLGMICFTNVKAKTNHTHAAPDWLIGLLATERH